MNFLLLLFQFFAVLVVAAAVRSVTLVLISLLPLMMPSAVVNNLVYDVDGYANHVYVCPPVCACAGVCWRCGRG